MREKAIENLKEYGYKAIEENGVLMILYDGPEKAFNKVFANACAIAKSTGYKASIGMRSTKKEGEAN
ncbi:hypothetical protein [Anaerocolumna xylanovorans]|uniref:Uncharacterized protein n=1 Tax=Anaerocolumna xylanovorans DSM 12503 TaxID=1121345 RepID=A0A1M7YC24_9FIRM|nr:hypothetical protein [Anaerocolumna xylanovorans]SHO50126.1 hypothetical protein SAMN02745217_02597 [Anaerocolumna xylanovorans DSM 12503]